jgi:spermidine synthase
MRSFIDLSNYYPDYIEYGDFLIEKLPNNITVNQDFIDYHNGADLVGKLSHFFKMRFINGGPIMSTDDYEVLTNKYFLDNANGDVLIFGLGMGFIVFPLLTDPSITSIKIVELNPNIISYVGNIIKNKDVNNKVTIVEGDAKTYYQGISNEVYDFIYFDYWYGLNEKSYQEMATYQTLYQGFKKDTNSIIYCWCQDIQHLILSL